MSKEKSKQELLEENRALQRQLDEIRARGVEQERVRGELREAQRAAEAAARAKSERR